MTVFVRRTNLVVTANSTGAQYLNSIECEDGNRSAKKPSVRKKMQLWSPEHGPSPQVFFFYSNLIRPALRTVWTCSGLIDILYIWPACFVIPVRVEPVTPLLLTVAQHTLAPPSFNLCRSQCLKCWIFILQFPLNTSLLCNAVRMSKVNLGLKHLFLCWGILNFSDFANSCQMVHIRQ